MDRHLVVNIYWLLEGPELETLALNQFCFLEKQTKQIFQGVKHQDEALECTLPFALILGFFLLFSDVRNVLNKCTAEKPCEANAGGCTFDDECRGNLICTRSNCEGSTMSLYAKCCQEPGGDIFYMSIWFGNHYKMVDIFFYSFLLYIIPKKNS